jgi:hypothetical protein
MPSIKKILNIPEAITHETLRKVTDAWSARLFCKVRVADVLGIEGSGMDDSLYTFALKAHFDFVITDEKFRPAFAVEFDGVGHIQPQQIRRDEQKDTICRHFDFPLLRINANYLPKRFQEIDLLTWFATAWFCEREHALLTAAGKLPYDDIFDPRFVISTPGLADQFPLWISRRAQGRMRKAFNEGRLIDHCPSVIVIEDRQNVIRALAWIMVDDDLGVMARTAFRPTLFNVGLVEAAEQIAFYSLGEEVQDVLNGAADRVPLNKIEAEINQYAEFGSLLFAFGGGKVPLPNWRRAGKRT